MKLMIIGHARHGKDTVCNMLTNMYGLTFMSSSYFVAEKCVRPYLEARGIVYDTLDQCYADRVNHRAAWFSAIDEYNIPDRARLGRALYSEFDMYCGLRNRPELLALKEEKAFDYCFWVDRSIHTEPESPSSCTVLPTDADFIIDNNGDMDHLRRQIIKAMEFCQTLRD